MIRRDRRSTHALLFLVAATALAAAFPGSSRPAPTAQAYANLSITVADSPATVKVGGQITYTITVTNNGPDAASDVVISDTLPSGTLASTVNSNFGPSGGAPPVCGSFTPGSGGGLTCRLGSLGVGAGNAWVVVFVVTVQPGAVSPISNTASVSSPTPDPNGANNSDTEPTTIEETTAVLLRSFNARRQDGGVLLRWQVGTELGVAGYHVYRQANGGRLSRTTPQLVPSRGLVGQRYRWLDRAAPKRRTVPYLLQAVYVDGTRAWIGRAVAPRS